MLREMGKDSGEELSWDQNKSQELTFKLSLLKRLNLIDQIVEQFIPQGIVEKKKGGKKAIS